MIFISCFEESEKKTTNFWITSKKISQNGIFYLMKKQLTSNKFFFQSIRILEICNKCRFQLPSITTLQITNTEKNEELTLRRIIVSTGPRRRSAPLGLKVTLNVTVSWGGSCLTWPRSTLKPHTAR